MSTTTQDSSVRKPLRLWPGVAAAAVLVVLRFIVPAVLPDGSSIGMLGAMAAGLLILLWWLFFSRAAWIERIGALVLIVIGAVLTRFVVHESIAGGLMGLMVFVYAIPATVPLALVLWAVVTRHLPTPARRATMVVAILLGCAVWTLFRTDGVMGETGMQVTWRWTPTAEERLLAREGAAPNVTPPVTPSPTAAEPPAPSTAAPVSPQAPAAKEETPPVAAASTAAEPPAPEWPGFRGAARDGVVRDLQIQTDWTASPPVELWRRPIGPGWSSFTVQGDYIYTQEQRGEFESVSAYRLSSGEPVWRHNDKTRFYESNGGAGPRGTPTLHRDRVYSLGATGIVNSLDARTGKRLWTRNAETDTGAPRPGWGFAGSPLVVGDAVIVAASGRLIAYDAANGQPRWTRTTGGGGYSSPHVATLHGVEQVLLSSGGGITSVLPADGKTLWEMKGGEAVGIVQPWVLPDGDVLLASGDMMGGTGLRRLHVLPQGDTWSVEERWSTRGLKPYFNDFVVHNGHAFGFDGTILASIRLDDGERNWKGGRYGAGQMVLLAAQDLLLVLSEEGEVALVAAAPDKHTELARFKAIEGKTWNHPVIVGDRLLVRNGEEMAAFRLPAERLSRR
jgi:hypothetical protein